MSDVKLGWASAEVKAATLTVTLDGELTKGWRRSFERTVTLLGHGDWGAVELKKSSVRVADVTPGTEEKLRHHLEAILAQANATLASGEDDRGGEAPSEAEPEHEPEPDDPDAEMTAQFRAFGGKAGA